MRFEDLTAQTILALAISSEEEDAKIYLNFAALLKTDYPASATVSSFVAGQVQLIATGASVADNMMRKNPSLAAEYKLLLKDSPNFIGVNKGEDKLRLKVNEIIAAGIKAGDMDAMSNKWLGRPAGNLPQ